MIAPGADHSIEMPKAFLMSSVVRIFPLILYLVLHLIYLEISRVLQTQKITPIKSGDDGDQECLD